MRPAPTTVNSTILLGTGLEAHLRNMTDALSTCPGHWGQVHKGRPASMLKRDIWW